MMKVKRVIEKQEIQNEEKEAARSEEEAKRLVSLRFHRQIHIFRKKASERMPTKKIWNYEIKLKKGFMPRKEIYPLFRKERKEVHEFIDEQLRKEYIRLLKSSQMALVFFIGNNNSKKHMAQNYRYLNK